MAFDLETAKPAESGGFDISTAQPVTPSSARPTGTNTRIMQEALYKGAAALPDMVLNAPNNLMNLGRAAFGTAATAAGRSDLAPELTPNPDLARHGLEAAGLIDTNIQPVGGVQKWIDLLTQGATAGALTGGASIPRAVAGAGMGALSSGAAGATEAAGGSPAMVATAGMLPGGVGVARQTLAPSGKTPILRSGNVIQDETFARANAEGYKTPPSAMQPTWLGNRVEGIGGKAALGQQTAIENQPVTNKIARREAGLAPEEPISIATLTAARDRLAAPYREVEALPGLPAERYATRLNPMRPSYSMFGEAPATPKELIHDWKSNNSRITELWNDYKVNHKVDTLDAYRKARDKQDIIESDIEKAAIANNRPDLVPALRAARVELAKNYDVERALNLGNGNVDAAVLGRMYDHGAKFTGGLETIAKFQQAFPSSARETSKVPAPGVSKLEGWGALTLGLAGHAMMPEGGGLLAALPLTVSPAARALALSKIMQGGRQFGPGMLSEVAGRTAPFATATTLADLQRQP